LNAASLPAEKRKKEKGIIERLKENSLAFAFQAPENRMVLRGEFFG